MAGKLVLTQPLGGAGIPGTIVTGVNISPATTVVVDSFPAGSINYGAKWIYTLADPIDEKVITAEIVANHQFGNSVSWNRSSVVGDMIPHEVNVALNGSDMELQITNNHTNTITANIVRIQVLA